MANLYRTISSTNSSWTFSTWMKISINSSNQYFFQFGGDSPSSRVGFYINGSTKAINMYVESTTTIVSSTDLLRDTAAWYHVVIKNNAGTGTVYVNGTALAGGLASFTCPSLSAAQLNVGYGFNTLPWYGYLAHTHLADGTAYDPTTFAETDATSGIWIAKTSPSVTYGTDGFFLKYASGAITTDSSGNGNTMTQSGTITANKDSPDNNFTTLEGGLITPNSSYDPAYSNGNTTVVTSHTSGGHDWGGCGTVGLSAGLWYWEVYINNMGGDSVQGILADPQKNATNNQPIGVYVGDMGYVQAGQKSYNTGSGHTTPSWGNTYTAGDYIGCYLDLTANKIYFAKNGTLQESGVGIDITAPADLTGDSPQAYFPAGSAYATNSSTFDFNFGNGYFGTTAISGAVADAGGEGQFKYNPSTGSFDGSSKDFRAICTNNIATYG